MQTLSSQMSLLPVLRCRFIGGDVHGAHARHRLEHTLRPLHSAAAARKVPGVPLAATALRAPPIGICEGPSASQHRLISSRFQAPHAVQPPLVAGISEPHPIKVSLSWVLPTPKRGLFGSHSALRSSSANTTPVYGAGFAASDRVSITWARAAIARALPFSDAWIGNHC